MNLQQVARELSRAAGEALLARRKTAGDLATATIAYAADPALATTCCLFYEYFHGDTGRGSAPATRPAGRPWSRDGWKTVARRTGGRRRVRQGLCRCAVGLRGGGSSAWALRSQQVAQRIPSMPRVPTVRNSRRSSGDSVFPLH